LPRERKTRDWQLAYLGRRTSPANITDFELRQAFTFGSEERSEIRRAFDRGWA
jgi:hypothetical protein